MSAFTSLQQIQAIQLTGNPRLDREAIQAAADYLTDVSVPEVDRRWVALNFFCDCVRKAYAF